LKTPNYKVRQGTVVKVDMHARSILEKWKENLAEKGIRVPLGGTIREISKIIKDIKEDTSKGYSKTDIKVAQGALDKLKEVSQKYDNPSFSDAVREMDRIVKEA